MQPKHVIKVDDPTKFSRDVVINLLNDRGIILFVHPHDAWIEQALPRVIEKYIQQKKSFAGVEPSFDPAKHPASQSHLSHYKLPETTRKFFATLSHNNLNEAANKAITSKSQIVVVSPIQDKETCQAVFKLARHALVVSSLHAKTSEQAEEKIQGYGISSGVISSTKMVCVEASEHY